MPGIPTTSRQAPPTWFADWRRRATWKGWQLAKAPLRDASLRLEAFRIRLDRQPVRFRIKRWYGRCGNNIQQVLIAMAHAEVFGGQFELDQAFLDMGSLADILRPFCIDNGNGQLAVCEHESLFFHYTEYAFLGGSLARMRFKPGCPPRKETLLSRAWIEANLHQLAAERLMPHLVSEQGISGGAEPVASPLVIHLRSGDVQDLAYDYYLCNPLWYYEQLSRHHRHVVLVTEPGPSHPLLAVISELFESCKLVSGRMEDDFETLRQARFLATSGVGTFPLAAALLSSKLHTFYASDAYQIEHLNPRLLDRSRVQVVLIPLPGFKQSWLRSKNRLDLLRRYRPR